MITYLSGRLAEKQPTRIVIDVGGVGYEVFIPLATYDRLPKLAADVRILIYDYIREGIRCLYGFMQDAERDMFEWLLGVNGIGPKIALSALSGLSSREIKLAVAENDVKRLSSISGVGKKMAERIVIELRHKLTDADLLEASAAPGSGGPVDERLRDTILALVALGYNQADAVKLAGSAVAKAGVEESVESLVRMALVK
jgi:Holliday junction DNA helicase RuvA